MDKNASLGEVVASHGGEFKIGGNQDTSVQPVESPTTEVTQGAAPALSQEPVTEQPVVPQQQVESNQPQSATSENDVVPRRKYNELREKFEDTIDDYKRDAKLFRTYKQKYGVSNEDFQSFMENPDGYNDAVPAVQQNAGGNEQDLSLRLQRLEEAQVKAQEELEMREAINANPEMAAVRDVIMTLGRTKEFENKSYAAIYNDLKTKVASQQPQSTGVAAQSRTEVLPSLEDGPTLDQFKRLSRTEKEKYLRQRGII